VVIKRKALQYVGVGFLSFVVITSCTRIPKEKDEKAQSNHSASQVSATEVIKSTSDSRAYRAIVLDNDLEVLLVSDKNTDKSAAALSVGVGSYQEKPEFEGLAHYLEHMLFLGTKTYPKVGEYSEFVSKNGGTQNAYTDYDHTNYMIAVNNDAYEEALDRFSGFFYEATLDANYIEKEKHAVHSEWSQKRPNDYVILGQLDGITLNKAHPVSQFSWGNLESLSDKKHIKLSEATVDFYNKYYSANLMKAALISNLSLDEMEALAKNYFGKVKNNHVLKPKVNVPVATANENKTLVKYVPQTEMKALQVKFVVENNLNKYTTKPNYYIQYLINSEMPGTVGYKLREMGLIESLYAYSDPSAYSNAGYFIVGANLTEKGLEHRDLITGAILKYINKIKREGISEHYFTEIKQSLSNSFKFRAKTSNYSYAMQIAASMQEYPAKHVLSHGYQFDTFDKKDIEQVLAQLNLENARVFYIDKAQAATSSMRFFDGKYQQQPISEQLEKSWLKAAEHLVFNLPKLNSLMPSDFKLVSKNYVDKPELIESSTNLKLFLGHSKHFDEPKGNFYINLNSNRDKLSAKNMVIARIVTMGLTQDLLTLSSEARSAGMWSSAYIYNGLNINVGGFTEHQKSLVIKVVDAIASYKMSDTELENFKQILLANLRSKSNQVLLNQLFENYNRLIGEDTFSNAELMEQVASIKVEEVNAFKNELFTNTFINSFAFGNYSKSDALEVISVLNDYVSLFEEPKTLYRDRYVEFAEGINWKTDSLMQDVAFGDFYFTKLNDQKDATSRVLRRILQPALFKQLRTEEQLAYSVGFFNRALDNQLVSGFYIQSPAKSLDAISDRIKSFKKGFFNELTAMSKDEFNAVKRSEFITLKQSPKNLGNEQQPYYNDWQRQNFEFDSQQKLLDAIKKVELVDVVAFYCKLKDESTDGRLVVQMRGEKFVDQPFANIKATKSYLAN